MEKRTRNFVFLAIAVLSVLIIVGALQTGKKHPPISAKAQGTTTVEPSRSPESSSATPGYSQRVTPRSESYTKAAIADHAKVLVWKYLGEPRYDEFTVTSIKTLVEGDMWEMVGKFAYLGQGGRFFDGIIEIRPNGDASLWGFSWK